MTVPGPAPSPRRGPRGTARAGRATVGVTGLAAGVPVFIAAGPTKSGRSTVTVTVPSS